MGLNRDQFLSLPDLPTETIDAAPWGTVTIKTLDALELLSLLEFISIPEGASEQEKRIADYETPAKIATRCMVDEQGNRILQDGEFRLLFRKRGAAQALAVIVETSNRLNSIFVHQDDARKNSEPSEIGDLPSV